MELSLQTTATNLSLKRTRKLARTVRTASLAPRLTFKPETSTRHAINFFFI
jgi:hypothetical protein